MSPAEEILKGLGVHFQTLTAVDAGLVNHVFLTEHFVVRIGKSGVVDHAREARVALAMLEAGVRTARPVAWTHEHSVWERVLGDSIGRDGEAPASVWVEVLNDLERVWANPPEPVVNLMSWRFDQTLTNDMERFDLDRGHRRDLERIAVQSYAINNPRFVHGDVFGPNVMLKDGRYAALIDWGCAGWNAWEFEFSRLPDRALALALQRHAARLDLGLLFALRLELFLRVALLGLMPWETVRSVLRKALEHAH